MKTRKRISTKKPKLYKNRAGAENQTSSSLPNKPEVSEKRPARCVHRATERHEHSQRTAYRKA